MPPRLSYDDVKRIFEEGHCTLVSTTYESNKKKLDYRCSCGNPNTQQITLCDFIRNIRCKECRTDRMKATNRLRYGCDYNAQRPEIREAALKGILQCVADKKHTIEKLKELYTNAGCELLETVYVNRHTLMQFRCVCGLIGKNTYGCFQAGNRCSNADCIMTRKHETSMKKFGETCYTKTKECQDRIKATCMEKYNVEHPMQNADIMEKAEKTGYGFKTYTFPSGRQERVQGYEPLALDHLLKTYSEDDIKLGRKEQPEIWYTSSDGIRHRYFSDIYIPKYNRIIEVKSSWTDTLGKEVGKIQLQEQACKDEGFIYMRLVFNDRGVLVPNDSVDECI